MHLIETKNCFSGNKKSLKELIETQDSTAILKQFVKDRYCVPEGMNLVMISNGKIIQSDHQIIFISI